MKISLREISSEGIGVERSFNAADLGFDADDVVLAGLVEVSAHLERADDAVLIKADVGGIFQRNCARCLEDYTDERADTFDIAVEVDEQTETIDLADEVRQELIVAFSSTPLCREDCKGICSKCGKNLNNETCECNSRG